MFAQFFGAAHGIGEGRFEHREIQEGLAAEEGEVNITIGARLAKHEIDTLTGSVFAHELRLLAVFGIDDFVLAVLVAIGAAKIALVRDVEDHRGQREILRRHLLFPVEQVSRPVLSNRADSPQLGYGVSDFISRVGRRQALDDVRFRQRPFS